MYVWRFMETTQCVFYVCVLNTRWSRVPAPVITPTINMFLRPLLISVYACHAFMHIIMLCCVNSALQWPHQLAMIRPFILNVLAGFRPSALVRWLFCPSPFCPVSLFYCCCHLFLLSQILILYLCIRRLTDVLLAPPGPPRGPNTALFTQQSNVASVKIFFALIIFLEINYWSWCTWRIVLTVKTI